MHIRIDIEMDYNGTRTTEHIPEFEPGGRPFVDTSRMEMIQMGISDLYDDPASILEVAQLICDVQGKGWTVEEAVDPRCGVWNVYVDTGTWDDLQKHGMIEGMNPAGMWSAEMG